MLITGACGNIGTVIRPALREGVEELRLSDLREPEGLVAPETYVEADLDRLRRRPARGRRRRRRRPPRRGAQRGAVRGDRRPEPARRLPRVRGVPARQGRADRLRQLQPRVRHERRRRAARRLRARAPGRPLRRLEGLRRGARKHVRRPLRALDRVPADRVLPPSAGREARALHVAQPRRRHPAGAGRADRRRHRLRDRLRGVEEHAALVAARRGRRLRRRRTTPRSTPASSTARTIRTRAGRTRRFDHGGWAT